MPVTSTDVSKTPIRTTLLGAVSILLPIILIAFTFGVLQTGTSRDIDNLIKEDLRFRKDLDDVLQANSATAIQQVQNTIDLSVVINEVKNTNQTINQLNLTVNRILESQ